MYLSDEVKEETQRNILSRLKKIEGQVRGLHGMVCKEGMRIYSDPITGSPVRPEIGNSPGVKELLDEMLPRN
jgi:hypothetical protein